MCRSTPLVSLSYLVALLVVDVNDLEAWSAVGSSNSSVGPHLFPYGCTPFFISSNGNLFLSSESFSSLRLTIYAPFFFFVRLTDGPSFVDGAWRPVFSLLTCDTDKYIICFLYIHIVSCLLGYIFIAWNAISLVVVEYTLCLLKCNHYVWQYFYNFQDNYWSSIVGNIIHCGHTCVHQFNSKKFPKD
jgi:hypothetical protein